MKRIIFAAVLSAASGLLFIVGRTRTRNAVASVHAGSSGIPVSREQIAEHFMLPLIVPLWIGAGLSDYLWHRRTKISTTAGTRESLMHLVMLAEGGPLILGGLLFEINAGVLALMMASAFAHEATAMFDIGYTVSRRLIPPGEQHTHSFLEALPFCIVSFFVALHWDQFKALFGRGKEAPRFDIRLREPHVSGKAVTAVILAATAFDILPHVEELWRCRRAEQQALMGRDTPECAKELFGNALVAE